MRRRGGALWATLLVAAAAWTAISAAARGGDPGPYIGVLATTGAAFLVGRVLGRSSRVIVPAAVLISALIWGLGSGSFISTRPKAGPFGYVNAAAAWYVQAVIAAAMICAAARRGPARLLAAGAMAVFGVAAIASGSAAAGVLLLVPVALAAAEATGSSRGVAATLRVGLALAVAATVLLGALGGQAAGRIVDDRRAELWEDAQQLIRDEPLLGVGPGRFAQRSPTARIDPDGRWAHNEFLHVGAETGVVGLGLLLALFLFAPTARAPHGPRDYVAALAPAAVVVLGMGACVDYLLHFAALPVTAAALAGSGSANDVTADSRKGDARWSQRLPH